MVRILLIDDDSTRRKALGESLRGHGHDVDAYETISMELMEQLETIAPDVIVIDTDSPDRDMLEHLAVMSRDAPRPVVLFTDDEDAEKMRQAHRAGVMSYVVGSVAAGRIKAILQVAVTRFEEHQALRQELESAKTELASRKLIERAKGVVMRHKGVSEDEAYRLLREMAMTRRMKLADVAQQVIDMSSMFS